MILAWTYWCVLVVLGIKILGNLALPYRVLKLDDGEGISLAFVLLGDIIIALALVVLALVIDRPGKIYEFGAALMFVCGGILVSYAHYFAVLSVASIINRREGRSRKDEEDSARPSRNPNR